jgi:hypothetical protein
LEIGEDIFLIELDSQLRAYADKKHGFVGLTKFVSYLGMKGFPYASAHGTIKRLSKEGLIEIYYVPNPFDDVKQTAAIRRAL